MLKRLASFRLRNVAQIRDAGISPGDLTVLVGPQASGKSIFLQFLRLVLETAAIHDQLRRYGIDWDSDEKKFLDVYLGQGMSQVWNAGISAIICNGRELPLSRLTQLRQRRPVRKVFYIPAQRVLSLANGWPRPFQSFSPEDPFSLRDFSETFRVLMEQEFTADAQLFPKTNRLASEYRKLLSEHIFNRFELHVDRFGSQRRLVLRSSVNHEGIPFLAWSAGQREFAPLLMGLYWLMPAGRVSRRDTVEWVIVEEPEMALHPSAISVVLLLLTELLHRGYRVCVSTHSPHVLDMVWALRILQERRADPEDILQIFGVRTTEAMKQVAHSVLNKKLQVFYFGRDGMAYDISALDPGSEREHEADWGGLTEFSSRVNDIVARIVAE